MKNYPGITIIIPNYNGQELLERFLPSVVSAIKNYPGKSELMIVDDASSDGSINFLKSRYPKITLIAGRQRNGFGPTCDRGVKLAKCPLVLLLNNDVEVEENFLAPLAEHFQSPLVFAVSAIQEVATSTETFLGGAARGVFSFGLLRHINYFSPGQKPPKQAFPTFYANGGASLFSREKYLGLGGSSSVYGPNYYWDDTDMSWRAWKRKWVVICEPRSRVQHFSSQTTGQRKIVAWKNIFLFNWRNLTDSDLIWKHLFWLPAQLFGRFLRGEGSCFAGFLLALGYLPSVLEFRAKEKKFNKVSDKEVLRKSEARNTKSETNSNI